MMTAWHAFIDATRDYYEARKSASEIYYAADKAYTAALAAQDPEHVEVINGNRQLE